MYRRILNIFALTLCMGLLAPALSMALSPATGPGQQDITLAVGHSRVITTQEKITRVSLASEDVADVLVIGPRELYVRGKAQGTTTLTLWGNGKNLLAVHTVQVSPDLAGLKEALHDILPTETGIRVMARGGKLALSGTVSSTANLDAAIRLAQVYASGEDILNLLQVGGVHQVMLEVRVAEMNRSIARRLGFNLAYAAEGALLQGNVFYNFFNNLTGFDDQGRYVLSQNVASAFTFQQGSEYWTGVIDALKENGLVRILAEPNLTCISGQNAAFLAGGEFPIPVPQGLGSTAIEWKEFGVRLNFTPTVLSEDRIGLQVAPEVSELDFTNALTIDSFTVPALSSRKVQTSIELRPGEAFAIAGLMQQNLREAVKKYPGIGEIPVLGALFSSSEYQQNESELVIIVIPHLVTPIDGRAAKLPTDGFIAPNDAEFFLFGDLDGGRLAAPASATTSDSPHSGGGFDGDIGHVRPQ